MQARYAFTLLELCVAVLFAAVLFVILSMGLSDRTYHHRGTMCANNLRNISLAAIQYEMAPQNAADLARPSSGHADGVYAGMADGSTRFLSDTIDYRVYQALMTPRGKNSEVPKQDYVLQVDALP